MSPPTYFLTKGFCYAYHPRLSIPPAAGAAGTDGVAEFDIIPAQGEEVQDPSLSPDRLVEELSRQKCAEVAVAHPDGLVIAADTVVSVGGLVLGKPHSREEAVRMLSALSGREHMVYTGVTLFSGGRTATEHEATSVRFRPLSQGDIDHYLATGEPMDQGWGLRHPRVRQCACRGHLRGLL